MGPGAQQHDLPVGLHFGSGLRSAVRTDEPNGGVFQQAQHSADAHDKSKHVKGDAAIVLANEIVTVDVAPDEIPVGCHSVSPSDVHDFKVGDISDLPARATNAQAPIRLA